MPKRRPTSTAPSSARAAEHGARSTAGARGPVPPVAPATEEQRQALLTTLGRMGFSGASPEAAVGAVEADLWVRPPGRAHVATPVFMEECTTDSAEARAQRLVARWSARVRHALPSPPSILVVASDAAAELAGQAMLATSPVPASLAVSRTRILVHPPRPGPSESSPHWHRLRLPPRTLLMLATGTLVGLAQRAPTPGEEGGGGVPIDVEGMLRELRRTFLVDIEGSLGVRREEDAMFLLYQLALKETYAPGDQGASLHELVNDPRGPAARLPWFAI